MHPAYNLRWLHGITVEFQLFYRELRVANNVAILKILEAYFAFVFDNRAVRFAKYAFTSSRCRTLQFGKQIIKCWSGDGFGFRLRFGNKHRTNYRSLRNCPTFGRRGRFVRPEMSNQFFRTVTQ